MIAKYLMTMAVAALPLVPARCATEGTASGRGRFSVTTPVGTLGVEGQYEYTGSDPDRTVEIENQSSEAICGTIEFMDEDGNVLDPPGKVELEIPVGGSAEVDVPPGAAHHKMSQTDCDEGNSARRGSPRPGKPSLVPLDEYTFRYAPSAHDVTGVRTSKEMHVRITTANGSFYDADLLADYLFAHGPDAPIPNWMLRRIAPNGVEVLFYIETAYTSEGVNLRVADADLFDGMELELNGAPYASIGDGVRTTSSAGWDVVNFVIPNHVFVYSGIPGSTWNNTFRVLNEFHDNPNVEYRGDLTFESN